MSFHLRHIFNVEVAAITVIILSVALIVYVVLSLSDWVAGVSPRHRRRRHRQPTTATSITYKDPVYRRLQNEKAEVSQGCVQLGSSTLQMLAMALRIEPTTRSE